MFNFLKKIFGKSKPEPEYTDEQCREDDERKKKGLEDVLGKMDDTVFHAIIPYYLGGPVDVYGFSNHIPGTALVTMELLDPGGKGPKPNQEGTYEIVMFTRKVREDGGGMKMDESSPFTRAVLRYRAMMTDSGRYGTMAVLDPGDTSEMPTEDGDGVYVIFDKYADLHVGPRRHHLLLIMEVFRSEMDFARKNGTPNLLARLKEKGHYPYSDLDREPVA